MNIEPIFEGIPFPDFDPIAVSLFGFLHIRWYALAYLGGFLGGWAYGAWLTSSFPEGRRPNKDDIGDILPWIAVGVILGGRLGYVLFYNFDYYLSNPLHIPFIWEGGMSFHGGLVGVILSVIFYARSQKIPLLQISDVVAAVVPIGLFLGRMSNFINGELFGRITAEPWGVIFPYGGPYPRHPSQIYEALSEGLILFLVLFVLMRWGKAWKKPGFVTGVFFAFYGFCRFMIEFVREPDPQLGLFGEYFSMGQMLSLPMMVFGVGLILYSLIGRNRQSRQND